MEENLDNEIVEDYVEDETIVDDDVAQDSIIEDEVVSDDVESNEILLIDRSSFKWLEYAVSDWVQTGSYYKLVIPYSVHGCLNAYVSTMLIESNADVGDEQDENGFENNIATWKLLSNDSIVIKSDEPIDCKILIKGEK